MCADRTRATALTALAPHMPETLLREALAAATVIPDDYSGVMALAVLAPHLPETERLPVLREALAAVTAISDRHHSHHGGFAARPGPVRTERPEAKRAARGSILWNPPDRMRVGRSERIEARIGGAAVAVQELQEGLRGRGVPQIDSLEISPLMRVTLTGNPSAFLILFLSRQDQPVRKGRVTR